MEPNSTHGILGFVASNWQLLTLLVSFFAGYLRLRFRVETLEKRFDKHESHVREDLRDIKEDIKKILWHIDGK